MMTGWRWRRGIAAFVLTLPVSVMAACDRQSSAAADSLHDSAAGLDPSGRQACAEFQSGWQQASDTPARLQLADTVERLARRSDSDSDAIMNSAAAMGNSADDGDRAWHASATGLLRVCRQAGWSTTPPTLPVTG